MYILGDDNAVHCYKWQDVINGNIGAETLVSTDIKIESTAYDFTANSIFDIDEKIVFITHYPPFNTKREPSSFTEMLEKYGVYKVVFGHLHGYIHPKMYLNEINGIKYYLTSCDAVKNKLVLIED